jgi:surface polysaccharide O-acyltransferase-like enzyme
MEIQSAMESKNDSRIIYLDLLRVVCTFAVVMPHTSGYAWSTLPYSNPLWTYANFYNGFFRFSVPIFIMISGVFMLSDKTTLDLKKLYSKKILRLVKLFFVYSCLYAIVTNIILADTFDLFSFGKQIILGRYHLWYLYAIIGLYIITPFIKEITKNNSLTKYFIVLAFIFEILIGSMSSIFKTVNFSMIFAKSYLFFVKGFTVYYVLGYFVYNNPIKKKNMIYAAGIIATVATIAGTKLYSSYTMVNSDVFFSFLSLNVFFQSLAIFVFFKEVISQITFSSLSKNLIKALSKYSLGVYLIHDFFLIIFAQFNINSLSFHPLFWIPLLGIIIFGLSCLSAFLISSIPVVKHIFN